MAEKKNEQKLHTSLKTFVDDRVQTTELTKKILNQIYSYYPTSCKVIAGFLEVDATYWRVNHYWDALVQMIQYSKGLDGIEEKYKKNLDAILNVLNKNPPDPPEGYYQLGKEKLGKPDDKSTDEVVLARYKSLRQSQQDFRQIIKAAEILKKAGTAKINRTKGIEYSLNALAPPGKSKHTTGYALDITGDHATIKKISESLGATYILPESPHVHVEFKNDVILPEVKEKSIVAAKQAVQVKIASKLTNATHLVAPKK